MNLSCSTCPVKERAACSVLGDEDRDIMARAGRTRILQKGEMLFAAGDEDTACATLLSGALKVASVSEEGEEQILALVHPAGFIGEMFRPFSQFDVVALTESRLCVFARSDMEHALERYPALALALLRRSQEDLHATRELLSMAGRGSATQKVAALVLAMAHAASDSPCHPTARFDLPLTRGEMANMLGLTIETVSRQLTRLERDGVLRKAGTRGIELLDPAHLAMLSGREGV
ncbi:MAG: transcriptional regulator [Erythrobacter sp. 34-65-8]|nr:MAG: transcriptional regulator [Erythrobacter sp. 34-65-8]